MQAVVGVVTLVIAVALAAIFLVAARRAPVAPYAEVSRQGAIVRRWWFRTLLGVAIVAFVVSLTWLPYQFVRARTLPGDAQRVEVTARQFAFTTNDCVPSGTPLEFAVSSVDVNHDFGIYGPDGRIVGQVQAMPGFVNTLRIQLDAPGAYTIHCLELCGPGHHTMSRPLKVGGCGAA